jgi:heavy metal-binding protein
MRPVVWRALFLLAVLVGASGAQDAIPSAVAGRFHHMHARVADPGVALDRVASAVGNGEKTLLRGHGVAVRAGEEYVVLDREDPEGRTRRMSAASAYQEARSWLLQHGVRVDPGDLRATAVAGGLSALPDVRIDAIGFSVPNVEAAVAALTTRGATPASRAPEVAKYRLPSGIVLEVMAETGKADAFWCPMHPDVRSPRESSCPRCGMALVAIPAVRAGEYALDVTLTPDPRGGLSGLRFVVREPGSGGVVRSFVDVHERPFHLFVVSRDLARFAHLHPTQTKDGAFELRERIEPGAYMLIADFLPAAGTPQMVHRAIVTPGYDGPLFPVAPDVADASTERTVDGLRIELHAGPIVPLRPSALRFVVSDAATGEPVTDLEPYLGAAAHLLVVSPDLTTAIHGHPEGQQAAGSAIVFDPVLPAAGVYKMWVQVQRKGRVITAPFVIHAAEGSRAR